MWYTIYIIIIGQFDCAYVSQARSAIHRRAKRDTRAISGSYSIKICRLNKRKTIQYTDKTVMVHCTTLLILISACSWRRLDSVRRNYSDISFLKDTQRQRRQCTRNCKTIG